MLRAVLTQGLVEAIGGTVTFVGALIAMLIIDPVLLGLTVLVVAIAITTVTLLSRRVREASHQAQEKIGDVASSVERAISAVRTIRAAGATAREIRTVDGEAEGAWEMGVKVAKISALIVPIAGIAMQVSFLVVLGVGGFRVAIGALTVANLVAFILFLFMMILPLGQAFGAITSVNQALGALGRIQEILDLPDEDAHDRELAPLALMVGEANAGVLPDAAAIEFDDVHFAYAATRSDPADPANDSPDEHLPEPSATERQPVLRGVSFRVPRGQRIALVGPSGAGKSTILALVERFYDPSVGAVRMGGLDLRSLDRTQLRAQIGYVEQDAPVLAGSLRDNLKLGSPDATDADCEQVLRAVNLGSVLDRDPAGLDAAVGEDGIMLSGGERQRLAIARALLAAPPILLLDESTSSLDGLNERMMREAIDAVSAGRTLIVIAHRLSTVIDSDRIIVLDEGRVIGEGTHAELVAAVPLYRDLAAHQLLV
jgi:ATP-binding cassette subfamily B protein